ncbi:MAG: ROK family transcriptional regulator [Firmicutes bacterium]|nr:ROK family transcriptional regulator [Bacillota bacterium]
MKIDNAVGNVQLMQKINRLKVLNFIRQKGEVARPDIAKNTGLSPSSVTNIVTYLMDKNLCVEVGRVDSKEVGRKAVLIRFNPSAANIISVNIETSSIDVAFTDLDGNIGNIIERKTLRLDKEVKEHEILKMIEKEISLMLNKAEKLKSANVVGIGIAVSGLVLNDERLEISTSMKWKGLSLKEYFEKLFHLPVYIQNNSKTKALAVLRKNGINAEENIIFLDLTMGVGIINFYKNEVNEAVIGEIGHTTVKKDGPPCFCGNRGCLEVMCSVDAVINQCNELLQQGRCCVLKKLIREKGMALTYETIVKAFEMGDYDVQEVLTECGQYLGIGIANIINIFNPKRIIINGDVLLTTDYVYKIALEEANSRAYEQFTKNLQYERVNIDAERAITGVSLYVTDKLFDLMGPEI